MFNQKISEARLAGKSWRQITAAANGKTTTVATQIFNRNYKSYCDNNNLEQVKTSPRN